MQNEATNKRFKIDRGVVNEYKGYTGDVPGTKVEEWNVNSLKNKVELFTKVVKPRKPIKIVGGLIAGVCLDNFRSDNIENFLSYDEPLQVERKHASGFGLGFDREEMSLGELLETFNQGDLDYYLTTQYEREGVDEVEDDLEEEEEENDGGDVAAFGESVEDFSDDESIDLNNFQDDYVDLDKEEDDLSDSENNVEIRLRELLQPPLTNLYLKKKESFPLVPDILSFLIPQQINLWLGANKSNNSGKPPPKVDFSREDLGLGRYVPRNGLSSGLHHDHSDNLYILFQGWKRFTLYPPSAALALETVGRVTKIYSTGIIDYEHPGWKHVKDDGSVIDTKEQEVEEKTKTKTTRKEQSTTPPSFSKIPPIFSHLDEIEDLKVKQELTEICQTKYPELLKLNKLEVLLSPGEMLYLPAGWFHEVTSYGFDPRKEADEDIVAKNNVHIALNYWFAPPNGDSADKPYKDSFWADDFKELVDSIKNDD